METLIEERITRWVSSYVCIRDVHGPSLTLSATAHLVHAVSNQPKMKSLASSRSLALEHVVVRPNSSMQSVALGR